MLFNYIKNLKLYFLLLIFMPLYLFGISNVDIAKEGKISLLEHSEIYITDKTLNIKQAKKSNEFKPYHDNQLNTGLSTKSIWIKFSVENSSELPINKLLIPCSPFLEHIVLYDINQSNEPLFKGVSHIREEDFTLFPFYKISLKPKEQKTYYLETKSLWSPIDFSIEISDERSFLLEDGQQQLIKVMLLSMIAILMIYSFLLSVYMREKGYFFYGLYLLTLLYQQGSYQGLTQIYFSVDFVTNIEIKLAVTKVTLMIISASLFGIYFLKTKSVPILHRIYKLFIVVALLELVIFNIPRFYNLEIPLATSILLIIFNMVTPFILYKRGNKEARLYFLGFTIVFVAYTIIIANTLGLISIMHYVPNILLWGTTIEALILSLAFADSYMILQAQKEEVDKNREQIIKDEVIEKTALLNQALKTKELLIQEIHHRIKNNLQIILSMVRLQSDKMTDNYVVDKFKKLENRINAIAKTYNLLLLDENLDAIDMEEYIESLLLDLEESMCETDCDIDVETDISAVLPLRESVYIGIVINELVTNAHKYAFDKRGGQIFVSLNQIDNSFTLIIQDNGRGFIYDKENKSLGLKLIHSLVLQQLRGTIEMSTENATQYTIKFSL
jgi:two-component sensor histidine kinase